MAGDERFGRALTTSERGSRRGEVFANRELVSLDLSDTDLQNASFERTLLVDCDLSRADLRGTWFVSCEIRNVRFDGARLGGNRFDGTILVDAGGLTDADREAIEHAGGSFQLPHASLR